MTYISISECHPQATTKGLVTNYGEGGGGLQNIPIFYAIQPCYCEHVRNYFIIVGIRSKTFSAGGKEEATFF